MKCLICKRVFFEKRTIRTLFSETIETKCYSCREKYFVRPFEVVYPISNYQIYMTIVFIKENLLNEDAFMKEIAAIVNKFIVKMSSKDMILFVDELSEELYDALDSFNSCDIFLISLYPPTFLV